MDKDIHAPLLAVYTDIKVLYDKPSQLRDGTPAREIEIEGVLKKELMPASAKGSPKFNSFILMTKRKLAVVGINLIDAQGRIGEDLKKYAYSLTFQKGREEPVKVPPDVRAFLDMWCTDIVNGDVKTIMAHFSDRFSWCGYKKAYYEQAFPNSPAYAWQRGAISDEATVTVFEPHGNKAYVDGFFLIKKKGDASALKAPMKYQQIINEHGEWKWFGNQR